MHALLTRGADSPCIAVFPASQSAEDDDKERSKERKAMMADLTAKVVRDAHVRAAAAGCARGIDALSGRDACACAHSAAQEGDTQEMKAMLARVSAIEKQLAAEAEEDEAAMERCEAKQKAALAALDESYAQKVAAIKASMKRLKDMAKQYCA